MILIGFSGKLRSGKTASMNFLKEHLGSLGYSVAHISFAKELKDEVHSRVLAPHNIPRSYLDDPSHKEQYRTLLTWYGTDFIRQINPSHWTDIIEEKLKTQEYQYTDFVLGDDVRFKNEASLFKRHGGTLVRLTRDFDLHNNDHLSEVDLDDYTFDYYVTNVGIGLDLLKHNVQQVIWPAIKTKYEL